MSFFPLKGYSLGDTKIIPMGNSQTIAVGDAIVAGGTGHNKAALTGASVTATPILGVVVGIVGANGNVLELQSVTTGAANETTPVHYVQYIPTAANFEYRATLSAAAGTTTGSDGMCYLNMSSNAGKLDEGSVAFIAGTQGQFFTYGLDDTDNANLTVIGRWTKVV